MYWQYLVLILYILSLSLIFIFSLGQAYLIFIYLKSKKFKQEKVDEMVDYPVITIQLPLYNEWYVIERLMNAVCELNYPIDKLEIQVLDDSTDESVNLIKSIIDKKQAEGFLIQYLKREKNIGYKAGALQYGLEKSKGEYLAIFDSDFVPDKEFLNNLMPYFKSNIGMVQSSWSYLNRNYSLLTKVQAFALDGHFSVEQSGRNQAGLYINFNGTAGIWRKKCIEDAGGWQFDTLTEDLDLSYRAQLKGWDFKYVENVHTPSELPLELNAFQSQQHRWTKGAIETSKKMCTSIWKSNTSLKKKLFGTLHLCNAYVFLLVFFAGLLSVPVVIIKNQHQINLSFIYSLSFFFLGFVIVTLFYCVAYFASKKNLKEFMLLFPLFISVSMAMSFHNSMAVLEGLLGYKTAFIRTPKFNINSFGQSFNTNKYINKKLSLSFYFEVLLSFYYLMGIGISFYYHDFGLLPFHFMLCTGFLILNYFSIKHRFSTHV